MAKITCAISGVRFSSSFLDTLAIPATAGYFHPVFSLEREQLFGLYAAYSKNKLSNTDSYLLYLALVHSSNKITWQHPATLDPNSAATIKLIANSIKQLLRALTQTDAIKHPSFSQPDFIVTEDNGSSITSIPSWIRAWNANIADFKRGRADLTELQNLTSIETQLAKLILSGDKPESYSHIIASWASAAADFPPDKDTLYQATIRSCFNTTKMFNTPLALLKEIKDYCECNIEAGSIHFHELSAALKGGIAKHVDYLGGSSLALGYTLLDINDSSLKGTKRGADAIARELKNKANVAVLAAKAPATKPVRNDYITSLEFLKASLAYSVAVNAKVNEAKAARLAAASEAASSDNDANKGAL